MAEEDISITFVVGAGASHEVDMPTGATLKERIAKMLAFSVQMGTLAGGDSLVRDALIELAKRKGGGLITHIDEYIRTAQLIGSAMPQAPSIDNFIDSHRDSAVVAECGKLAIAGGCAEFCVNGQSTAGAGPHVRKHNDNQETRRTRRTAGQLAG